MILTSTYFSTKVKYYAIEVLFDVVFTPIINVNVNNNRAIEENVIILTTKYFSFVFKKVFAVHWRSKYNGKAIGLRKRMQPSILKHQRPAAGAILVML